MLQRPRRNRSSAVIRSMVEETRLSVKDMLFPLFVMEGKKCKHRNQIHARHLSLLNGFIIKRN